jgi:hypothetical protein
MLALVLLIKQISLSLSLKLKVALFLYSLNYEKHNQISIFFQLKKAPHFATFWPIGTTAGDQPLGVISWSMESMSHQVINYNKTL